jgi:hypothetical protein
VLAAGEPVTVSGEELRHTFIGAAPDEEDRRRRLQLERAAVEELMRRRGPDGAGMPA